MPTEVTWLLTVVDVSWPATNGDQVRAFAGSVRDFATGIGATHQAASRTVEQMSSAYSGSSYEQLVAPWARMSDAHLRELLDARHVARTSLDAAADTTVATKTAGLGQLAAMAASLIADQTAAALTFRIAEAAEALITQAARTLLRTLEQQPEQHSPVAAAGGVQPVAQRSGRRLDQVRIRALQELGLE